MLGQLKVSLGLDAAEFTAGLTRSEYQAKRFGETLERSIANGVIKAEIAIRALGQTIRTTAEVFQSLTSGAGVFQDLAEETQATAEDLASLAVSAAQAGVGMDSIAGATNRLTKGLVGVDDESKAVGAALQALNIPIEDFKRLDPVAQYEAVGRALDEFADGAGKVAVAQALFGKSGAEQLKVFAALREAGGRQTILTQQQIELADSYADAQAKAGAQLRLYAQAAASEAIPALTDLSRAATEFLKTLIGVDEATGRLANNNAKQFAKDLADGFAFAADQVLLFVRLIELATKFTAAYSQAAKAMASGDFQLARAIGAEFRADLDEINKRLTFTERLAKVRAQTAAGVSSDPYDTRFGRRPQLNFGGTATVPKGLRSAVGAERTSDAERYLRNLEQQLQRTQDLSVAETVLADIEAGRLKLSGSVTKDQLLGIAVQIDAAKIFEQSQRDAKERTEEFLRDEEKKSKAIEAVAKAEQDRLDALLQNTPSEVFRRQQDDIDFLRKKLEALTITAQQYAEGVDDIVGRTKKTTEEANDAARELGMTFSSAFEDAIVEGKKFSDVLRSISQDITRILIRRLVTEPLANSITGAIGGDFLKTAGSWLGSLFGGGKAAGGPTMPNTLYRVGEHRAELYNDGSSQFLMTGSRRGWIDPNPGRGGGRAGGVIINITVPGSTSSRTASQIAAETARAVALANARNN